MEQTERSETLLYKIQTLGNFPEESINNVWFMWRLKYCIMYLDIKMMYSVSGDYNNEWFIWRLKCCMVYLENKIMYGLSGN